MTPRLELRGISKSYPGVLANDDISLSVLPGEIHAVLGENGAGKSTLMKIIYGATPADAGQIYCDGKAVPEHGPAVSRELGIEMVYQHFALFESITVVENIALSMPGKMDLKGLALRIREVSERYGLPIDPDRLVLSLSVGERQRVEIVRCLLRQPKLLILDEPTSVLTPQAVRKLFETLRQLSDEGCSILYISHKLDEVRELCHSATVLRGGKVTGETDPRQATSAELARMMVGKDLPEMMVEPSELSHMPLLSVNNLNLAPETVTGTSLKAVSLEVFGGEIVGIAGVSGNGQGELAAAISGEKITSAAEDIVLEGRPIGHLNAGRRRDLGLGFVPEERLGRGAVPPYELSENALLTAHRLGMVKHGMANRRKARDFAADVIEKYNVKASGPSAKAHGLSGGNLQKFIMGREIELSPKVLLVSQPTWGVDVGAAAYVRQTLIDLSRSGQAVIVISEELEELFEICDRLYVICNGELTPSLNRADTNVEEVGLLMTGTGSKPAAPDVQTESVRYAV
ncbi:ABC transporter ATP-binding protein [Primorskyibacter flagellatus]|uniref:Nucleoside ABC transporter ATP-binding protein n=1 Tax=Primorskyibacter flagellatus TaxID=1387277 RepID=A0A1W2DYF2_9RHOB|nr:ABC transporter ATP-binding protein [Primorskyibacter flagellatus]SMD02162.1 nucleoside ABC transporter ATP-binding protein [Primorskyibacter flagellatus]